MPDRIEKLIKKIYRKYKSANAGLSRHQHPDEEDIVSFLEAKLGRLDSGNIKKHLLACDKCMESVEASLRLKVPELAEVLPDGLMEWAKNLPFCQSQPFILEIVLKAKEKILKILNTNGDVLFGQELVPAPVLRSRGVRDFKGEVTILKDFKDIRVEIKVESRGPDVFSAAVLIKEKDTQKAIKDLRVTLVKDRLELESYLNTSGKVVFERILSGKYTLDISAPEASLASILLDIRM